MMNFRQYLSEETDRASDEAVRDTRLGIAARGTNVEDAASKADPRIWTAREIDGNKYLFYVGKILDVTGLKREIDSLYGRKGYTGYGFSKLAEPELIRYASVKDVLMKLFASTIDSRLDPSLAAERLFMNEPKDFDWKPEAY